MNSAGVLASGYPHDCGEHSGALGDITDLVGLSPRLRGTHYCPATCRWCRRVIPTTAGNTFAAGLLMRANTGYPHDCGEHITANRTFTMGCGLSPRLRGTPINSQSAVVDNRVIPTTAGNTVRRQRALAFSSGYPHDCGEHSSPSIPSKR